MSKNWNERFVSYALFNGNSPEKQLEIDREEYPGGVMCGFICWISKMQQEFKRIRPDCFLGYVIHDQKEWSRFLREKSV